MLTTLNDAPLRDRRAEIKTLVSIIIRGFIMVSYMIPHVASRVFLGEVHWTIEYHITLLVFAPPPQAVDAKGRTARSREHSVIRCVEFIYRHPSPINLIH